MRELPPVGTVWVPERVLDHMVREAERMYPLESGGVLIGYWVTVEKEVVITDATGPGPRATHEEERFTPDDVHDASEIGWRYESSCHLHSYLGDWHSHPRSPPWLSRRDRRTLQAIAIQQASTSLVPLMAIIGQEQTHQWELTFWRFVPRCEQIRSSGASVLPLKVQQY